MALIALVALGAALRSSGFTTFNPWFDDAWSMLPARVGLSTAIHMVVTTPGYTLGLRSWIKLDPSSMVFAQLPGFALALLGIVAVPLLLRSLKIREWLCLLSGLLIACSPVTVTYAMRVKEYAFDLVAACVVLALAERCRQLPSAGRLVALVVASVVAMWCSASTVEVAAAAAALLVVLALVDRARRAALLAGAGVIAASAAVLWWTVLRGLPPMLSAYWRYSGFLVSTKSHHPWSYQLQAIGGGLLHGFFALPIPFDPSGRRVVPWLVLLAAFALLGLVALSVLPLWRSWRDRGQPVDPAFPAAVTVLIAIVAVVLGAAPLGGGRTDEVLYPALAVVLAAPVERALRHRSAARLGLIWAAVGVVAAGLVLGVGITHRATYPTFDLSGLCRRLPAPVGDTGIVVDGPASFTWAYADCSPTAIAFTNYGSVRNPTWVQGFHPVSTRAGVVIEGRLPSTAPALHHLLARVRRLWFVSATYGAFPVGQAPSWEALPVGSATLDALRRLGWRSGGVTMTTTHAYATLLVAP